LAGLTFTKFLHHADFKGFLQETAVGLQDASLASQLQLAQTMLLNRAARKKGTPSLKE